MMATLTEQRLDALPWLVARGSAEEAFRAVGGHLAGDIRAVVADMPGLERLRQQAAAAPGARALDAAMTASQAGYPEVWAELAAMASGAGVPLADLALLNFRGDIGAASGARPGPVPGSEAAGEDAGAGCSDLAWRNERALLAHNEDDEVFFDGRCLLLTLLLDGLAPVTAFCKPGFVPSTAFTVAGPGVVWGIDHLPVAAPGSGAGRHIVARGLQRAGPATAGEALVYLRRNPPAGGFAYVIGDRAGRVVIAETVAGDFGVRDVGPAGPLDWHTNHGRLVPGADAEPGGISAARGEFLQALPAPDSEPDAAWLAGFLTAGPLPAGVRADPVGGGTVGTLCTFATDLTAGLVTVLPRGAASATIPLADLALGRPQAQQPADLAWPPAPGQASG